MQNLAANTLTIPAHQACLDFPGANFCGSLPFAWHKIYSLGEKEQPSEEQAAATQAADIICRSHSGKTKRGAHCAEACPGSCKIFRCLVARFEEPWGGLQRPGMRSQELQNKPKKWSWSSTQGEDGKMFGKIWKAINAKKRILLENYIRTQAEDRWADRDSFGCQQVSHLCSRCRRRNDFLSCLLRLNDFLSCLLH